MKKKTDKLQQVSKKFADQELTMPYQLELFQLMQESRENYSHTVRLYDLLPKYFYSRPSFIGDRFLDTLERDFEFNKKRYKIRIKPARISDEKSGVDRDAYPGKREEIIEDALRKMAADGRRADAVYLDGQLAVIFSRKSLIDELAEQGHTYSYPQIDEALQILFNTSIELSEEGVEGADSFHPISDYGIRGRNGEDCTYVKFCPMVTDSLRTNTFRLVNYKKLMSYNSTLARKLHKRMSNSFTQAAEDNTYHFSVTSIYRDFGLSTEVRLATKIIEVRKALEELKSANVVRSYQEREVLDTQRKNKKVDYIIELIAHDDFIQDVIKANGDLKRRNREILMHEKMPFLPPERKPG